MRREEKRMRMPATSGLIVLAALGIARAQEPPAREPAPAGITPEAHAAIGRLESLVHRPGRGGAASIRGTVVTRDGGSPIEIDFTYETKVAETPRGDVKPFTVGLLAKVPLGLVFEGPASVLAGKRDVRLERRDGRQVIVATTQRAGKPTAIDEIELDSEGLAAAVRRFEAGSADKTQMEMTLAWTKVGDERLVERATVRMNMQGRQAGAEYAFRYAEVDGVRLLESFDCTLSSVQTGGGRRTCRIENLVVDGEAVELPRPEARASRVSPEAKAAIQRCKEAQRRPPEGRVNALHGDLVSADGSRRHSFRFQAPNTLFLQLASGVDQDSPAGRFATDQLKAPLRAALVGVPLVTESDYDAVVETRLGARVLTTTNYRDGANVSTTELVLDEVGLPVSCTMTAVDAPKGRPFVETRWTWETTPRGPRVAAFVVVLNPEDPASRTTTEYALGYAEVGGIDVLAGFAMKCRPAAGTPWSAELHVENLVLNGEQVELSKAGTTNK
jgi:hypothetical protein